MQSCKGMHFSAIKGKVYNALKPDTGSNCWMPIMTSSSKATSTNAAKLQAVLPGCVWMQKATSTALQHKCCKATGTGLRAVARAYGNVLQMQTV